MSGFEVERESQRGFAEAGTLLAHGLQDNPNTVAVFRCEAEERSQSTTASFAPC